ncbi:MAG TPA: sulfite exporter TauE/SafE family protein [Blastocatellia bacterium]|nr:sulfite exporter TauE/SafE family protein [Blastocatellia bacterium]HMV86244.1 sulfite exporter TauE/SafE family protein [Blastocatellia bacterium]HMZ19055.1 sulfite exporter TauE/SafE family protein [Blastocatellia bacterium]HNG30145.1 sulfite exporter TauE/SafE family protein [Blastocatellia bacterium]
MLTTKSLLFLALGVFTAFYLFNLLSAVRRKQQGTAALPDAPRTAIGFIANFFDTLGIGSFATTTSMYKFWKLVKDELLPGTLNVGHTLPTITQAFIYIAIVEVEMTTLIALIAASVLGMWLGAGVVSRLPRRTIQIGMGIALLVAAGLTLMTLFDKKAGGGTDMGLHGAKLAIGVIGNFTLGALMSLGIGLYGPCLIMISLLGMNPKAAFPIMMGSCAFLMPVGSTKFIQKGSFDLKAALGLALGGIPAVLIAAYIVKEMNLKYVRGLVVVVVVYTAFTLLYSAMTERNAQKA